MMNRPYFLAAAVGSRAGAVAPLWPSRRTA